MNWHVIFGVCAVGVIIGIVAFHTGYCYGVRDAFECETDQECEDLAEKAGL